MHRGEGGMAHLWSGGGVAGETWVDGWMGTRNQVEVGLWVVLTSGGTMGLVVYSRQDSAFEIDHIACCDIGVPMVYQSLPQPHFGNHGLAHGVSPWEWGRDGEGMEPDATTHQRKM